MKGETGRRYKPPGLLLREVVEKRCSTLVKTKLLEGLLEQLGNDITQLRGKEQKLMSTAASQSLVEVHSNTNPEDEQLQLWQQLDQLQSRIIEMKQVSMHYKSMVECYDEEQDDLNSILEIKKDVASDLERKIQQSRSKLQTKRLIETRLMETKLLEPMGRPSINSTPPSSSRLSHRASTFLRSFWR